MALRRHPQSHRIVPSGMLALATLPAACPAGGRCGKRPAGCGLALAGMPPAETGTAVGQNRPPGLACRYATAVKIATASTTRNRTMPIVELPACHAGTTTLRALASLSIRPSMMLEVHPLWQVRRRLRPYVGRSSLHLEHRCCSERAYGRTCRPQAPKTRVRIASQAIRIFLKWYFFAHFRTGEMDKNGSGSSW